MNTLLRNLAISTRRTNAFRTWLVATSRKYGTWEPDYVNVKPEIPEYGTLNIQLKGYDFTVLESFAKYVHKLVESFGLENASIAVPTRKAHITILKPQSTKVVHEYDLNTYERIIQIEDLQSTTAPILFEVIHQNLPEGINMVVKEPDPEETEFRYIPDLMLNELQQQMEAFDRKKK